MRCPAVPRRFVLGRAAVLSWHDSRRARDEVVRRPRTGELDLETLRLPARAQLGDRVADFRHVLARDEIRAVQKHLRLPAVGLRTLRRVRRGGSSQRPQAFMYGIRALGTHFTRTLCPVALVLAARQIFGSRAYVLA